MICGIRMLLDQDQDHVQARHWGFAHNVKGWEGPLAEMEMQSCVMAS
jgi:hypothetical protein